MNKQGIAILLVASLLFGFHAHAQEGTGGEVVADNNKASVTVELGINEVALLKVQSIGPIQLVLRGDEAGKPLQSSASDSTNAKLLISSVISSSERILSAQIVEGSPPAGTHLEVAVQPPSGNFVGQSGVSLGSKALSSDRDENLLTGIATCYSGTDSSDGYPLKFSFMLDGMNYESIRAVTLAQVTVLFTLTAANNAGQ
jgi:hypothetical protein